MADERPKTPVRAQGDTIPAELTAGTVTLEQFRRLREKPVVHVVASTSGLVK